MSGGAVSARSVWCFHYTEYGLVSVSLLAWQSPCCLPLKFCHGVRRTWLSMWCAPPTLVYSLRYGALGSYSPSKF